MATATQLTQARQLFDVYATGSNPSQDALNFWANAIATQGLAGATNSFLNPSDPNAPRLGLMKNDPEYLAATRSGPEVSPNPYSGEGSFQKTAGTQGNIRSLDLGDDFQEYEEIGTDGPYTIYRVRSAYGDDLGTIRVQTGGGVGLFLEGIAPLLGFAAGVGGLGAFIGGGLGLTGTAANVVGNAIASGLTTGAITGDWEKAAVAGALAAGGSYLSGSGLLGDAMDAVGLGDYKATLGVLNSQQTSVVTGVAADAVQLAGQGLGVSDIQTNLIAAGVDPTVAASAANMAVSGASAAQIAADITGFTGGMNVEGAVQTGPGTNLSTATGADSGGLGATTVDGKTFSETVANAQAGRFGETLTGDATFSGIEESSKLAGGTNTGMFGDVGTGGFGNALGSATELATNLANAGLATGTANNLAGLTAAGTGATSLLGGATALTGAETLITNLVESGASTSTIVDKVKELTGVTDTKTITDLIGKVVNTIGKSLGGINVGGLLGAGIDYAQLAALQREAEKLGAAQAGRAEAFGQQAQVPFTPYTITTGGGTATIGPGSATSATTPAQQAIRDAALAQSLSAVQAINPAEAAQTFYNQVEALAAPGRTREQLALQERLQRQGLMGFGSTLPTTGGGARTVNPLFESLLSAQETARAQQALQAQQFGTAEAARMQALSQSLLGQGQQINAEERAILGQAQGIQAAEQANRLANANRLFGAQMTGLSLRSPYEQIALKARGDAISGAGALAKGALGLPTQQGNSPSSNLFSGLFGLIGQGFDPSTISSGLDISGESQATQNLIDQLQQYGIF